MKQLVPVVNIYFYCDRSREWVKFTKLLFALPDRILNSRLTVGIYEVYTKCMSTAVINIKTDPALKKEAQAVAGEIGISLSSLIKAYLKQLVKSRKVTLSETPSAYMIRELKKSAEDIKKGRVSPVFKNADDAFAWLDDPKAKLKNGDRV